MFLGVYLVYFHTGIRPTMGIEGSWFIYALHLILIGAFIAASGIDLELWIIPAVHLLVRHAGGVHRLGGRGVHHRSGSDQGLLAAARGLAGNRGAWPSGRPSGLAISWLLLRTGVLKRSYEQAVAEDKDAAPVDERGRPVGPGPFDEPQFNHRLEALREVVFLLPIIVCAVLADRILTSSGQIGTWWNGLLAYPAVTGLLGSLFGYFVGCATVWATRILGTLGFGKEAMGLGDVHLMGAAGAVVGPVMVVIAFFIAPFFGLGWALFQMLFKKIRQIPYGPFLSLAILTVMIFHDWILNRVNSMLCWVSDAAGKGLSYCREVPHAVGQ